MVNLYTFEPSMFPPTEATYADPQRPVRVDIHMAGVLMWSCTVSHSAGPGAVEEAEGEAMRRFAEKLKRVIAVGDHFDV